MDGQTVLAFTYKDAVAARHEVMDDARLFLPEDFVEWMDSEEFVEQLYAGLNAESVLGTMNTFTNVTDDDPVVTAKIVIAHLLQNKNYYAIMSITQNGVPEV